MSLIDILRGLMQRRRVRRELDDELAFHLEMETEANIARGMTPADARQAARRAFGSVAQVKDTVRDVRTLSIESLLQDGVHAWRTLRAHPRVSLAAAGMLALAIGLTTAMFTVVDSLVVQPVPFRDAGQLAHLWMGNDRGGRTLVTPAVLDAWRENPAFEGAESAMSDTALIEVGGTVVMRELATVTPGVFELLGGVTPVRGRLFDATEGRPGQSDRVLVSETVWRGLYNSDPALVGQSVVIDGERVTVIGILPADFRFPRADTELWRPTSLDGPDDMALAYVRFTTGVPRDEALKFAETAARAADPRNATLRPRVSPLVDLPDAYSGRAVPLLTGAVALVFLVLCANVCSLLLARMTARRDEITVRSTLGASRFRLMRQVFTESAILGIAGVGIGTAIGWGFVATARALLPQPLLLQTLNPLNLDERALLVTSASGLLATFATGLLPAWLATQVNAEDSLRPGDRGGTETRTALRLTRGLLVVEVALACMLLVGGTLLTRSFVNLSRADRGLDATNVTGIWLALPPATAPDVTARAALTRAIEEGLRQLPGIEHVAWSYGLPPDRGMLSFGDWLSDLPDMPPVNLDVTRYVVSPEFFPLYRVPIVRGRVFDAADSYTTVIVSERMSSLLWGQVDPIGRTFRFDKEQFQVIGVAREIHYPSIDGRHDGPEFYHPYTPGPTAMASLRCLPRCPDPSVIRHHLASAHPSVVVQSAEPVEADYAAQLARPRAAAALAMTFAAIALIAAAGGLFSVMSYAVSRRRREFGVRSALGASPHQIRRVVLRDALVVTTSGLAVGSLLAVALTRTIASLQYGVTSSDPLSWSLVFGLVAVSTLAAAWSPARTAASSDPLVLLRD